MGQLRKRCPIWNHVSAKFVDVQGLLYFVNGFTIALPIKRRMALYTFKLTSVKHYILNDINSETIFGGMKLISNATS